MTKANTDTIYLDNAATTAMDPDALEVMVDLLKSNYSNPSQIYSFSKQARNKLRESRECIAKCIGAREDEIFFTSGGTESDNWAIKCVNNGNRSVIISTEFEHHAILNSINYMSKKGVKTILIKPNKQGFIETDSLKKVITSDTRLVSVMMVNNELGTIQPIKELCKIAHDSGALFHTDAVQAVGHIPINVKDLDIDLLSASAHKFNGPKGIGFLYVKRGTNLSSFLNGGKQERGLRAGTENVPAIASMAVALKNNIQSMTDNSNKLKILQKKLLDLLTELKIDYVLNTYAPNSPGLLNISFPGIEAESLQLLLDLKGIQVSTGSACNSGIDAISHVMKSIGLDESIAHSSIRVSIGKNNKNEDIIKLAETIHSILKQNNC